MNTKNICLLGFSKQSEKVIKEQLDKHCSDYTFEWVSANAKNLDGVIINALFLDTPQISKYVSAVSAPCVAIHTQTSGKTAAEERGIVSIGFSEPLQYTDSWLDTLFGAADSSVPVKKSSVSTTPQGSSNYQELLQIIKSRKSVYITATCDEKIAYIEPKTQHAYINFAREDIPGIEQWRWYTTNEQPNTDSLRRINLEQWVFESIWQSKAIVFNIDSSMLYKLIRWPQPFSKSKRSEALRLAAQIKFSPVSISELIDKTQFPPKLIEQFLFATNQAGQVEVIPLSEKVNSEMKKPARKQDPDREVKKSFIGRLRSKLGL